MSAAATFVVTLFNARTSAHLLHLGTRSYAVHKALDEFYNELIPLVDSWTEAYQGRYGRITDYPLDQPIVLPEPLAFMSDLKDFVITTRAQLPQDSELQNLVDEIMDLIDGILYKLTLS